MLEKLKALLIQMASYLSIYELGVLLGIFFIFIMFFTLGLLLRGRRFIARFFFFLSILTIFSTPFALQAVMQKLLYKVRVEISKAHVMQYTQGFFVSGTISNKGKIAINECQISVDEVRDERGSKLLKAWNTILPKSTQSVNVDVDIEVGKSADFAVIVPTKQAHEPFLYRIYVDCYLSNKFAQTMQKAQEPHTPDNSPDSQPSQEAETAL